MPQKRNSLCHCDNHHGRIVKYTGDGALVEFGSVVDAVRCADEIQRGMAEQNTDVPQDAGQTDRCIHVGDIKYGPVEGLWRSLMYGSWQPQT